MAVLKKIDTNLSRYWDKILLTVCIIASLFYGLYWLICLGVVLFILAYAMISITKRIKNSVVHSIVKNLVFILVVFSVAGSATSLVFGVFKIPSSSMENTLFPKDVIFVNKLIYGPKVPGFLLKTPFLNSLFQPNKRLNGTHQVAVGDILVFKKNDSEFMVKRCLAVAGDLLRMDRGEVFVNDQQYPSPSSVRNKYSVEINARKTFFDQMDSLKIESIFYPDYEKEDGYFVMLSEKEFYQVKSLPTLMSIEKNLDSLKVTDELFVNSNKVTWTLDNIDEFSIPKKRMKIILNERTFALYGKTIRKYEEPTITYRNKKYYIKNQEVTEYSFDKDYIFVLGDNRKNSQDSRYLGFIPQERIVGKVQYIVYSNYEDSFRWKRFLKRVD